MLFATKKFWQFSNCSPKCTCILYVLIWSTSPGTDKICFHGKIRKIFIWIPFLTRTMPQENILTVYILKSKQRYKWNYPQRVKIMKHGLLEVTKEKRRKQWPDTMVKSIIYLAMCLKNAVEMANSVEFVQYLLKEQSDLGLQCVHTLFFSTWMVNLQISQFFCFFLSVKKDPYSFYFCMKTYVVGTHQKCLTEALLMSTHNLCYYAEIRKLFEPVQDLYDQWRLRSACTFAQSDQSLTFYCIQAIQRRLNENLCHTRWIYRPIWVFAGHTGLI